jgi:hypothetical protein
MGVPLMWFVLYVEGVNLFDVSAEEEVLEMEMGIDLMDFFYLS